MNILFLFRNLRNNIRSRKRNFIFIFVLATVTFYLLDLVIMMSARTYFSIYEMNKTIDYEGEVINIYIYYDTSNYKYGRMIYEFDKDLQEAFPESYGKFMYMEKLKFNTKDGERELNVLYVDNNLLELINLKDNKGNIISPQEKQGMLIGYAGTALKDDFFKGAILDSYYGNTDICVVGKLEKDSVWIARQPLHSLDSTIDLDNFIVTAMDEKFLTEHEYSFCANITNSMYIMCDEENKDSIKKEISQIAKKNGIMCYVDSINELIEEELLEKREMFSSMGMLVVFSVVIAVIAFFTVSIADNIIRQRENGILHIIGGSKRDLYFIDMLGNLLKYGLGFFTAVLLYGKDLAGSAIYVHSVYVIPMLAIIMFVLVVLISFVPVIFIKKKGVLGMLGGGIND